MASKTDIANLTIACHAGEWVEDIDGAPGRLPEAIQTLWTPVLEIALAAHPWKTHRTTWRDQPALPAAQNPDPDRGFAYRLPADCVRVFETRPKVEFDEWEGVVTSNAGPTLTLVGTRRNVEVGRFSAFFNDFFAKLLAYHVCTPISASEAIRERCKKDAAEAFSKAASDSGRAGVVRAPFGDNLLKARVGAGSDWGRR